MMLMPGLGRTPNAERMTVDAATGVIDGLM